MKVNVAPPKHRLPRCMDAWGEASVPGCLFSSWRRIPLSFLHKSPLCVGEGLRSTRFARRPSKGSHLQGVSFKAGVSLLPFIYSRLQNSFKGFKAPGSGSIFPG